MAAIYDTISIIGMGLIGSSIALASKKYGLANHVIGCARTEETCQTALDLGLAERMETDPAKAVEGADLVILCTPVGTFKEIGTAIAPLMKPGATLTDVGSVKQAVVDALEDIVPADIHFIPGHPVAGTEQSGPTAGFSSLFKGRWCILTPPRVMFTSQI